MMIIILYETIYYMVLLWWIKCKTNVYPAICVCHKLHSSMVHLGNGFLNVDLECTFTTCNIGVDPGSSNDSRNVQIECRNESDTNAKY